MSWPIVLHGEQPPNAQPGDAWPLGDAWAVKLPGGAEWHTDYESGPGLRWDVTGEMPSITVNPSINDDGVWHGWIKDGVISDDVEGRTYG